MHHPFYIALLASSQPRCRALSQRGLLVALQAAQLVAVLLVQPLLYHAPPHVPEVFLASLRHGWDGLSHPQLVLLWTS
jgi:hypothetical protein